MTDEDLEIMEEEKAGLYDDILEGYSDKTEKFTSEKEFEELFC